MKSDKDILIKSIHDNWDNLNPHHQKEVLFAWNEAIQKNKICQSCDIKPCHEDTYGFPSNCPIE